MDLQAERELRLDIIERLGRITSAGSGGVSRQQLTSFETAAGARRLIDQSRGIWNPRDLQATLSVVSSPSSGYRDEAVSADGLDPDLFRYDYRSGTSDGDNRKLRRAYELSLPIILLRKVEPGVFAPLAPVYVVGDDMERRQFILALDEGQRFLKDPLRLTVDERRYAARVTRQRLHQPEFRVRVLRAYDSRCAMCGLEQESLLDAAHIIGDGDADGLPVASNGLCLCKIHHAAYDQQLLGVAPDLVIHIRDGLCSAVHGNAFKALLADLNGRRISVPKRRTDRPDRSRLAVRFSRFEAQSAAV